MKLIIEKFISYFSILLVLGVIVGVGLNLKLWKFESRVIAHDVKTYYAYLPALFIYQDIGLDTLNVDNSLNDRISAMKSPNGRNYLRYSMGNAILYAPFFLSAHIVTPLFDFEQDGYSPPYKIALLISCAIYLFIGLLFLRKYLLEFYSGYIVALSLFAVVIGTNLLFYSTIEAPMTHAYSFSLIAIFIYLTPKWYKSPSLTKALLIGALFGLIVLIRPSNVILLIFFILYGVDSVSELKKRVFLFIRKYYLILLMLVIFFMVWLPQFLYWKYVSGHYLFYSYSDQGFYFGDPQIIKSLFSYRKGWLVYTPIMGLAIIGLFFLRKYQKGMTLPIAIFLVLNIYILSSWFQWYFGGSFGLRAYIDSYSILVIPFAALCQYMFSRKLWVKISFLVIVLSLVYLNIFQTRQYYTGAIHWVNMNKEAYWETFGKLYPTERFIHLLNPSRTGKGIIEPQSISFDQKYNVFKKRIMADSAWLNSIILKAESRNIPLDSMIRLDFKWMMEQKRNNSEK